MIYRRSIAGCVFLMMAAISWSALADTPSHSCKKPVKPAEFNENRQVEMFNDEVSVYKQCISDFADEQRQVAEMHRQAASDAIEEWNNFVNDELN